MVVDDVEGELGCDAAGAGAEVPAEGAAADGVEGAEVLGIEVEEGAGGVEVMVNALAVLSAAGTTCRRFSEFGRTREGFLFLC